MSTAGVIDVCGHVLTLPSFLLVSMDPTQRLELPFDADGAIRVIPVAPSPVKAFRGMGRAGGATDRLLAERSAGERVIDLPEAERALLDALELQQALRHQWEH